MELSFHGTFVEETISLSSRLQMVCSNKYWELFVCLNCCGQTTHTYRILRLTSPDRKQTTYFKNGGTEFCGVSQKAFIHFVFRMCVVNDSR